MPLACEASFPPYELRQEHSIFYIPKALSCISIGALVSQSMNQGLRCLYYRLLDEIPRDDSTTIFFKLKFHACYSN